MKGSFRGFGLAEQVQAISKTGNQGPRSRKQHRSRPSESERREGFQHLLESELSSFQATVAAQFIESLSYILAAEPHLGTRPNPESGEDEIRDRIEVAAQQAGAVAAKQALNLVIKAAPLLAVEARCHRAKLSAKQKSAKWIKRAEQLWEERGLFGEKAIAELVKEKLLSHLGDDLYLKSENEQPIKYGSISTELSKIKKRMKRISGTQQT